MATVPPVRPAVGSQDVVNAVKGAVSADGTMTTVTTQVFNAFQDKERIVMTLINGGEGSVDRENIWIFPAAWMPSATHSLPANVSATIRNFTDWAEFVRYYLGGVETTITGIKMSTDDVDNFDSELIIIAKAPNGKITEIPEDIGEYKVNQGGGNYAPELYMPFNYTTQKHLFALKLSKLKANSQLKLYIDIAGVNKSGNLSPMQKTTI